jgi:hypothetical protein
VLFCVEKHVLDEVSQQFVPPLATAGQLFWQSESIAQDDGQALPPPPPELDPDEVPPPDEEPLIEPPPLSSLL